MATISIRIDDDVKREAVAIADQLGLTFNTVVNVMLREFNRRKGFPFPVTLQGAKTSIFAMDAGQIEQLCKQAVRERTDNAEMEHVTLLDTDTNTLVKQYKDGREESIHV